MESARRPRFGAGEARGPERVSVPGNGTHLARMLSREAHDIVLMDDDQEKLSTISGEVDLLTVTGSAHSFSDLKETGLNEAELFIAVTPSEERNVLACTMASYLGDGRNIELLNEEGLDKMDALVATTGSSETNILACHLAKTSGVRRTVAEVENFAFMGIAEGMDIGRLVNKKLIAASHIYRFTLKAAITNVTCLSVSDAEVFEFIANPDATITRKPIRELGFPAEAIIGGIIRDNHGFVARGDTQIREGDRVVVFSLFGSLPYMFSGTVPGLTDAFFETVSGFTTTGSSVVADADSLPKGWWASR